MLIIMLHQTMLNKYGGWDDRNKENKRKIWVKEIFDPNERNKRKNILFIISNLFVIINYLLLS